MCGINGIISNKRINKSLFYKYITNLRHRGPDDLGIHIDNNIALGHTRLSILDLSEKGHQPMVSDCGDFVIVYNGEVYNFDGIKKNLEKKGYKFQSNTDTEVILKGFIEYKEKILDKLNGMFAFAIYNKRDNSLFLARDRSGIKPLYYADLGNVFAFSSELKGLPVENKSLNEKALIYFLVFGSVPEPFSIYKNIYAFPAGYYGIYKDGKFILKRYYEYTFEPKFNIPYDKAVNETKNLFYKSVERHLISDAPIGVFLSGGLDSSSIVAVAKQFKEDVTTISLVFNEKEFSEEFYQNKVVDKFKTNHIKFLITEKLFLEHIQKFLDTMEQPTIDGLNTYFVSLATKENGLKAVLSGIGGDEIFFGYPSFRYIRYLKFIPIFLAKILKQKNSLKKFEYFSLNNELGYYLLFRGFFTPSEISEILNISLQEIFDSLEELYTKYYKINGNFSFMEDINSYFELSMYMKNQLLKDSDLFSMAHSVEIRVPLLDKELLDFVLKVKPNYKFGKYNKQLLVDTLKDILPREIYNRKKMGFTLPFEVWFRKNIDMFNIPKDLKKKFLSGQEKWAKVWGLYVLNKFLAGN